MTYEEKRAWIRLVAAVLGYAAYLGVVLGRAGGQIQSETPYAWALGLSVLGAGLAAGAAEYVLAVITSQTARAVDERDREIDRLGDRVGQSFIVIGALAAMSLAMFEMDHFWIANTILLGFALSAIVGGAARVVVYRTGVPQW